MATITDYASLQQAVQDWFVRSDLGAWMDYFIQIAEEDIYRDIFAQNQGKGVQAIEAPLSVTINSGVAAVPSGYLGIKIALVSLNGQTFEIERRTPEFIYTQFPDQSAGGTPQYMARLGQNFVFGPYPDSAYTITGIYWQKSAHLSSTNTTTWMTSTIPSILLSAVNRAAARFIKDEEAYGIWDGLYNQQLQSYVLADKAEELSGSSIAMVAA
jgi:hypothetical protein